MVASTPAILVNLVSAARADFNLRINRTSKSSLAFIVAGIESVAVGFV